MDNHPAISDEYVSLTNLLHEWAKWQENYSLKRMGYPSRSAGLSSSGLKDFDDMWEQCHTTTMECINTCINDLEEIRAIEYEAILYTYLGKRMWVLRSNRREYIGKGVAEILVMAHESLIPMVKRKGVVL